MKKVILSFALLSLVVLTSFTTTENQSQNIPTETGDDKASNDTGGGGQIGNGNTVLTGNKRLDYSATTKSEVKMNSTSEYSNLSLSMDAKKKSDI